MKDADAFPDPCIRQDPEIADARATYRYSLMVDGKEIYVGPHRPEHPPGAICTRQKWIPGQNEWKLGDWGEKERVF